MHRSSVAATNSLGNNRTFSTDLANVKSVPTADVWIMVRSKVLPLFKGERLKVCIEELNELVRLCLDNQLNSTIREDLGELLLQGMKDLNAKVDGVTGERLVARLVDLWSFFYGTVLPYLEGAFLPLQMEIRNFQYSDNVRNFALTSFRDNIILKIPNLKDLFPLIYSNREKAVTANDYASRLLQMFFVLSSIQSKNEEQKKIDTLLGLLKETIREFQASLNAKTIPNHGRKESEPES